jgi:predicted transcriptional regulator
MVEMGGKRDSANILAAVLRACEGGTLKTKIMLAASINYDGVQKYVKIAVYNDFLQLRSQRYYLTKKGEEFIVKHDRFYRSFKSPPKKALTTSETPDKREKRCGNSKLTAHEPKKSDSIQKKSTAKRETPNIHSMGERRVFQRINTENFRQELCALGFKPEEALEISSWVNLIFLTKPVSFSGRRSAIIKACLTYIGSRVFSKSETFTQRRILLFYGLNQYRYNQLHFKDYLKILQQAKPEVFRLKEDFRQRDLSRVKHS